MDRRKIALAGFCAAALSLPAFAQESTRRHEFEFTIGIPYLQSETTTFEGGTVVDTESSTGLGFSFDWRFADRWSAGATLAMHDIDYTANIALAGSALGAAGEIVRNDLDTQSLMGHVKRYFGNFDRVAPYAKGALGWVSIDTNIPTGPPVGGCWFDPWWGPVCDSFQPTRTTTEMGSRSASASAGTFRGACSSTRASTASGSISIMPIVRVRYSAGQRRLAPGTQRRGSQRPIARRSGARACG